VFGLFHHLQLTLIGWVPAAIWAAVMVNQYYTDQKINRALANQ